MTPDGFQSAARRPVQPFIPARLEFVLFSGLVSGMMSLLVSGISTLRSVGPVPDFLTIWIGAWLPSWAVAFLAIMFVVPFVRSVLARLVIRQ